MFQHILMRTPRYTNNPSPCLFSKDLARNSYFMKVRMFLIIIWVKVEIHDSHNDNLNLTQLAKHIKSDGGMYSTCSYMRHTVDVILLYEWPHVIPLYVLYMILYNYACACITTYSIWFHFLLDYMFIFLGWSRSRTLDRPARLSSHRGSRHAQPWPWQPHPRFEWFNTANAWTFFGQCISMHWFKGKATGNPWKPPYSMFSMVFCRFELQPSHGFELGPPSSVPRCLGNRQCTPGFQELNQRKSCRNIP